MRIVCFGDSITFGEFVDRRETWVHRLAEALPEHDVVNRGVCGETTRLALERAGRDIYRDPPDILLVQFGLNDLNRWESEGGLCRVSEMGFEANLYEIALKARAWGTGEVVMIGITSTGRPNLNSRVGIYDEIVRDVARAYELRFISCRSVGRHAADLHDDGVHLSPEGHRRFFNAVLPHFTRSPTSLLTA